MNIQGIIRLLRPNQWVKNLFVFLPTIFGRHLQDVECWISGLLIFCSFCLLSSAVYCLNDICDAEADRLHPVKLMRPIASGEVSAGQGTVVMVVCLLLSVIPLLFIGNYSNVIYLYIILGVYVLFNLLYSFGLKRIAIIDVFVVALGYVLRVIAGGLLPEFSLSHWIVLMTFLLTLFIAFAKRRDDVLIFERTGQRMRKSIDQYSIPFINACLSITASITMVCYLMYTISDDVVERIGCDYLYVTAIFVFLALLRFLQIVLVYENSGSPTKVVMHDRVILGAGLCWLLSFMAILYL